MTALVASGTGGPSPDEFEGVPALLLFLAISAVVIIALALLGCSADVNVHGVPERIALVAGGCTPDAGSTDAEDQ